jgi:hypothetical protein
MAWVSFDRTFWKRVAIAGLVVVCVHGIHGDAQGVWALGRSISDASHRAAWTVDARRTHDLERLRAAIDRFFVRHGDFPADLELLVAEEPMEALRIHDPETGAIYGYRQIPLHPPGYRLCANFVADAPVEKISFSPCKSGERCFAMLFSRLENRLEPGRTGGFWDHGIGKRCWAFSMPKEG